MVSLGRDLAVAEFDEHGGIGAHFAACCQGSEWDGELSGPEYFERHDMAVHCLEGVGQPRFVPVYTFPVPFVKQLLLADVRRSAWANQNLLEACAALTAEEMKRDFRISHTSILSTLSHIYDGERVWLHCLSTTADRETWRLPTGAAPEYSFDALRQNWPQLWEGFGRWLEDQSESGLEVDLNLQLPGGIERRFPRWKILRHVLEHSTMHCGQVVGMIRMLGHQPPATSPMDYYLAGEPVVGA